MKGLNPIEDCLIAIVGFVSVYHTATMTRNGFVLFMFWVLTVVLAEKSYPYIKRGLILGPPGWSLRRFAEFCFSKKTYTQVLEPPLSDMQKEHFEALAAGRLWKARMVLVRGYWSFWSAVGAQLPISFARRIYEVWKATKIGS